MLWCFKEILKTQFYVPILNIVLSEIVNKLLTYKYHVSYCFTYWFHLVHSRNMLKLETKNRPILIYIVVSKIILLRPCRANIIDRHSWSPESRVVQHGSCYLTRSADLDMSRCCARTSLDSFIFSSIMCSELYVCPVFIS